MKNLREIIQEKLKINSKSKVYSGKVGDIIENYELNGKKYNLVCCISADQANDNQARFIIDDADFKFVWLTDQNDNCRQDVKDTENGKEDINGKENNEALLKYYRNPKKGKRYFCVSQEILERYGNECYLPAAGELKLMHNNLETINSKLENKISEDDYYWSSTQANISFAYTLQTYYGDIAGTKKMQKINVRPFIQI